MPLVMSQRHTVHNEESKKVCGVKIKNAKPEDSGIYSLVVENPYGADDSSAQVVVTPVESRPRPSSVSSAPSPSPYQANPVYAEEHQPYEATIKRPLDAEEASLQHGQSIVPPRFVVGLPANHRLHEGEPIILSCQVEGSPKPSVNFDYFFHKLKFIN